MSIAPAFAGCDMMTIQVLGDLQQTDAVLLIPACFSCGNKKGRSLWLRPFIHSVPSSSPGDEVTSDSSLTDCALLACFQAWAPPPLAATSLACHQVFEMLPVHLVELDVVTQALFKNMQQMQTQGLFKIVLLSDLRDPTFMTKEVSDSRGRDS